MFTLAAKSAVNIHTCSQGWAWAVEHLIAAQLLPSLQDAVYAHDDEPAAVAAAAALRLVQKP